MHKTVDKHTKNIRSKLKAKDRKLKEGKKQQNKAYK